jgi:hypothetical protein
MLVFMHISKDGVSKYIHKSLNYFLVTYNLRYICLQYAGANPTIAEFTTMYVQHWRLSKLENFFKAENIFLRKTPYLLCFKNSIRSWIPLGLT